MREQCADRLVVAVKIGHVEGRPPQRRDVDDMRVELFAISRKRGGDGIDEFEFYQRGVGFDDDFANGPALH